MTTAHLRDLSRYRRATDLYAKGRPVRLESGDVIFLMSLNTIEKDEAVADAQAARAQVALALKDPESKLHTQVKVLFESEGLDEARERLVQNQFYSAYEQAVDELEEEEGWRERIALLRRGPSLIAVAGPDEQAYFARTQGEFLEAANRIVQQILDRERERIADLSEEEVFQDYIAWWADMRGGEVGLTEYRYTELFYAARACAGVEVDEGKWDHSACEQHRVRIYEHKEETRHEPDEYLTLLFSSLAEMEVTEREAKSPAALAGSSDSSAPRSEQADSTDSSPEAAPSTPPGTSSPPSTTP